MTTIAYARGILAADSQTTSNGLRDSLAIKIHKINGLLVAGAGNSAVCIRFVEWVRTGMRGPSPYQGEECGNSFIVTPDEKIIVWGSNGPWFVDRPFYAMGSGEQIALGAMAHGASAEQAVAHAITFDVFSGGPIRTLRL